MQLIPETQARFGVTRPFDAQQNIRGAMISPEVAGEAVRSGLGEDQRRLQRREQARAGTAVCRPIRKPRSMCSGCSTTRGRIP